MALHHPLRPPGRQPAAFARTHALALCGRIEAASIRRGEKAFAVAIQAQRTSLARATLLVLALGLPIDLLLSPLPFATVRTVGLAVAAMGVVVWAFVCPIVLLASGLWAIEGRLDLALAAERWRRSPRRIGAGWLACAAVIAIVSSGALTIAFRTFVGPVLSHVPTGLMPPLAFTAFYVALIAFQLSLQGAFAAWAAPIIARSAPPN